MREAAIIPHGIVTGQQGWVFDLTNMPENERSRRDAHWRSYFTHQRHLFPGCDWANSQAEKDRYTGTIKDR